VRRATEALPCLRADPSEEAIHIRLRPIAGSCAAPPRERRPFEASRTCRGPRCRGRYRRSTVCGGRWCESLQIRPHTGLCPCRSAWRLASCGIPGTAFQLAPRRRHRRCDRVPRHPTEVVPRPVRHAPRPEGLGVCPRFWCRGGSARERSDDHSRQGCRAAWAAQVTSFPVGSLGTLLCDGRSHHAFLAGRSARGCLVPTAVSRSPQRSGGSSPPHVGARERRRDLVVSTPIRSGAARLRGFLERASRRLLGLPVGRPFERPSQLLASIEVNPRCLSSGHPARPSTSRSERVFTSIP